MNSCFKFTNVNGIMKDICCRCDYENVKITSMCIDSKVIYIELDKYLCENIPSLFNDIMGSIICSQNIFKPQYVTNHIIKEATLDVEGDKVIINIICNEEFDENASYK